MKENLTTLPPPRVQPNNIEYRVYFQIQILLGNSLDPKGFVYETVVDTLTPQKQQTHFAEHPVVPPGTDLVKNIAT